MREKKTVIFSVAVTPRDLIAIDRAAARAGFSRSGYMRACTLTIMVSQLDSHALAELGSGLVEGFSKLFLALEERGGLKT